jgi:hypothetical protein
VSNKKNPNTGNIMRNINRWLAIGTIAVVSCWGSGQVMAQGRQGRGNFDPAQFQQRMMDRMREQLEVKSDDDWKVLEPKVQAVMEARRGVGGFGRGFGRGRGNRGGGPGGAAAPGGNNNGGRRGFGPPPNPAAEALQQAIDNNAPSTEIKSKLAALVQSRKDEEAKLQKAQDELRGLLSVRQEAIATLRGLLN